MPASLLLSSAALSIASLDLCADEYALMLARPGQVVSVSHLGADPRENVHAARARGLHRNDGTIADVAALRPDLVIASRGLPSGAHRLAEKMGTRIVTLPYAGSPGAVARQVDRMASLFDNAHAAQRWQVGYHALESAPPLPHRKALWIGPAGISPGPLTSQWLGMAGVAPLALSPGRGRIEQIVRANPELVVESDYRGDQWHRGGAWRDHPLVRRQGTPRVQVDGRAFTCSGPAMVDTIAQLRADLG